MLIVSVCVCMKGVNCKSGQRKERVTSLSTNPLLPGLVMILPPSHLHLTLTGFTPPPVNFQYGRQSLHSNTLIRRATVREPLRERWRGREGDVTLFCCCRGDCLGCIISPLTIPGVRGSMCCFPAKTHLLIHKPHPSYHNKGIMFSIYNSNTVVIFKAICNTGTVFQLFTTCSEHTK